MHTSEYLYFAQQFNYSYIFLSLTDIRIDLKNFISNFDISKISSSSRNLEGINIFGTRETNAILVTIISTVNAVFVSANHHGNYHQSHAGLVR